MRLLLAATALLSACVGGGTAPGGMDGGKLDGGGSTATIDGTITGDGDDTTAPDSGVDSGPPVMCMGSGDCAGQGVRDICRSDNLCVECTDDDDCNGQVCDLTPGTCVECTERNDCTDDLKPECKPDSKTCVRCLSHDDCGTALPKCNDAYECVECLMDAHCVEQDPDVPHAPAGGYSG